MRAMQTRRAGVHRTADGIACFAEETACLGATAELFVCLDTQSTGVPECTTPNMTQRFIRFVCNSKQGFVCTGIAVAVWDSLKTSEAKTYRAVSNQKAA